MKKNHKKRIVSVHEIVYQKPMDDIGQKINDINDNVNRLYAPSLRFCTVDGVVFWTVWSKFGRRVWRQFVGQT